jgi:HEAT repeat protein
MTIKPSSICQSILHYRRPHMMYIYVVLCVPLAMTIGACSPRSTRNRIEQLEIASSTPPDVKKLLVNLRSGRAIERGRAMTALTALGPKAEPAIPFLIVLLDDNAVCNRLNVSTVGDYAMGALCGIGKPSAQPLLTAVTNQTIVTAEGTALALLTLGQIGDKRAVETAITNLSAQERRIRRAAAEALRHLRDVRAFEALAKAIISDTDAKVRWTSALALGSLGDPRGIEYLVRALEDDHDYVRSAAVSSLERLTGQNLGKDVMKWQQWFTNRNGYASRATDEPRPK